MYAVDLNCDLGESYGNYICGMDEEVIPYISSANIACGFHASDPMVMAKTVALAKSRMYVSARILAIQTWWGLEGVTWQSPRKK